MTGAANGRPAAFTLLVLVVLVGVQRITEPRRLGPAATVATASATVLDRAERGERVRRAASAGSAVARPGPSAVRPLARARSPRGYAWPPVRAPGRHSTPGRG